MYASAWARPLGQMHKIQRDLWGSPPTPSARANSRCYIQEPTSCHPTLQVKKALTALQDTDLLARRSQPTLPGCHIENCCKYESLWSTFLWTKENSKLFKAGNLAAIEQRSTISHSSASVFLQVCLGRRSPYIVPEAVLHCPNDLLMSNWDS